MASIAGQWIGAYAGSNSGTFIIELDEIDGHYEGTAVAWDDRPEALNALISFRSHSLEPRIHLDNINLVLIDNNGNTVPSSVLDRLKADRNVIYPSTVSVVLTHANGRLEVNWSSSVGTHGKGYAEGPKTRSSRLSDLKSGE